MTGEVPAQPVKIWDAPLRLVHWLMVVLIAISWWTAEQGELEYHRYSGYTLLGLLVFRIYWGFAGSETARFASFIKGPGTVWQYLRQMPSRAGDAARVSVPGHNPLGALSVIVLLLLMLAQVTLGLFAVDIDGIESGPLSYLVSFDTGRTCAEIHETLFNFLLGFIGLHIAAVAFYLIYKRENLIASMIHGRRRLSGAPPGSIAQASLPRLIIGIVLAAIVVWLVSRD